MSSRSQSGSSPTWWRFLPRYTSHPPFSLARRGPGLAPSPRSGRLFNRCSHNFCLPICAVATLSSMPFVIFIMFAGLFSCSFVIYNDPVKFLRQKPWKLPYLAMLLQHKIFCVVFYFSCCIFLQIPPHSVSKLVERSKPPLPKKTCAWLWNKRLYLDYASR